MESSSWLKKELDSNTSFLKENLLFVDIFFGFLIGKNLFSDEIIQKITNEIETSETKIHKLVSCLERRDDACVQEFLSVLDEKENGYVRERLKLSISKDNQSDSREDVDSQMLLKAKDELIGQLEKQLAANDRRIKELEEVAVYHKNQTTKTLEFLRDEIRISRHYQERCEQLIEQVRIVDSKKPIESKQIGDKDDDSTGLSKQLETLEQEKQSLEKRQNDTIKELKANEDELKGVAQREIQLKRNLRLSEGATDYDLRERILELVTDRLEFTRVQKEFSEVNQENLKLNERIATLSHEKDKLMFDIRQNELQLQRLRRSRGDRTTIGKPGSNRRMPLGKLGKSISLDHQLLVTNIDPRKSALITKKLSQSMRSNNGDPEGPQPRIKWPSSLLKPISEREMKYCVLCRKSYYLKSECSIHVQSVRNGKFPCCDEDAVATGSKGCRKVHHMYIYFTGVGNDYCLYDDQDRQLDFTVQA